jgi:hypothetical protein
MVDVIGKVGVELEAAWDREFYYATRERKLRNWDFTSDGSISSRRGIAMEAVSKPFEFEKLDAVLSEVERGVIGANKTMGFHIHVSPKRADDYEVFSTPKFVKYFKAKLDEFTTQKSYARVRRRYNNRFCAVKEMNETTIRMQKEATGKSGARYAFINFCKGLHGTIEFRVFPSSACVNTLRRFVWFVVRTMNEYYTAGNFDAEVFEGSIDFFVMKTGGSVQVCAPVQSSTGRGV